VSPPDIDPRLAALRRQVGPAAWADRVAQARRREAVVLQARALREEGVSLLEASRALGASAASVARWDARHRRAGLAGLIARQGNVAAPRPCGSIARRRRRDPRGRKPHTFVKWAGSKLGVMDRLLKLVPPAYGTYYEPMVGAGTLFFALRPGRAILGDVNEELMTCYGVIRDHVERLLRALARHRNTYEHFLRVRAQAPADLDPVARAARLIFLNKTCYNGLYRVNRQGRFNVPYGRNPDANFRDAETLRRLSTVLRGVTLRCGDYRHTLADVRRGDFVYLDPPYFAATPARANRVRYQAEAFDVAAHRELADVVRRLDRRGCHVLVSNADTRAVRQLYRGFRLASWRVRRPINRALDGRDGHRELAFASVRPAPRA
jgi:DNA adenine methylase